MIDPLEAAIQFLKSRPELAGLNSRIANKHKYGEDWSLEQASLLVVLDDSDPDHYVPVHQVRLEVSSYAATDAEAMDNWMLMLGLSRSVERTAVSTSQGSALIYSFLPESGPSYLPDKDLDALKRVLSFWRISVSEIPVT